MLLAGFFVQPHPQAAVLPVNVFNIHTEGRADAGKGKDQETNPRAVAQADHSFRVDAVEQTEPGLIAPVEAGGPVLSLARVGVSDIRGEEFDEAPPGSCATRVDQCWHRAMRSRRNESGKLVGIPCHGAGLRLKINELKRTL
jgi:hypothetical protein